MYKDFYLLLNNFWKNILYLITPENFYILQNFSVFERVIYFFNYFIYFSIFSFWILPWEILNLSIEDISFLKDFLKFLWIFLWIFFWNFIIFIIWILFKKILNNFNFKTKILINLFNFFSFSFFILWFLYFITGYFILKENLNILNEKIIFIFILSIIFFIFQKILINKNFVWKNIIILSIFFKILPFFWFFSNIFLAFYEKKFYKKILFIFYWSIFLFIFNILNLNYFFSFPSLNIFNLNYFSYFNFYNNNVLNYFIFFIFFSLIFILLRKIVKKEAN